MPIDKIIPRFLVSDKDERLLKEGAMTDALNVTISEDGDGTEGVLKNVKGTTALTAVSGSELTDGDAVTVIGQVSDSQRGFIYFFVADASATGDFSDGTEHAIYQLNAGSSTNDGLDSGKYRLIFRSSSLKFDPNGFVKADVLNGEFKQDGNLQSILYFTDNLNPPRKINVDRAIDGEYNSSTDFDLSLSSIKAAPNRPPSSSFSTDTNQDTNMFQENAFQYATQYIFKDGEESAISPYSQLATSRAMFFSSIGDTSYAVARNTDNVCDIVLNVDKFMPDMTRVRLLARRGNTGSFFVVDEFDPTEDKDRNDGSGTDTSLYSASSQTYHFRNDTLGATVPNQTIDKLYDNVPFKAQGQAIVGNRLMYSNYTEGRANTSPEVDLVPVYNPPGVSGSELIDSADVNATHIAEAASGIGVDVEIHGLFGKTSYSASDKVPAGTTTKISFTFKPLFNLVHATSNIISIPTTVGTNLTATSLDLDTISTAYPDQTLTISARNTSEVSYNGLRTQLVNSLDDKFITINYNVAGQALSNSASISSGTAVVKFRFDNAVDVATDGVFKLSPLVEEIVLLDLVLTGGFTAEQEFIPAFPESVLQTGGQQPSTPSSDHILDREATASSIGNVKSFKAGSMHELGVVYYDKFNRSGNVNRLGSFYAEWFGSTSRPSGKEGPTSVTIEWDNYQPPSWADRWQIVYSGATSYESYAQYTVGGAYYVVDSSNNKVANDQRIYVNLETLEEYKSDKSSLRNYSFTEGDKLRVISYDTTASGNGTETIDYPMAIDGGIIEFNVVGTAILADDTDNPLSGNSHTDGHSGFFVILEHPSITSGVDGEGFTGFDWYSISNTDYDDSSSTTSPDKNYWGQKCVVEIMTPRKATSETVFYEIGVGGKCGGRKDVSVTNDHGPNVTIDNGDVKYRLVPCKAPYRDSIKSYADRSVDGLYQYSSIALENETLTEKTTLKDWDKGRPHAIFENSAEIRRRNGITYSDAYAEDVAVLSLSSFNASLANFDSLEGRYGPVEYIGNYNDDLVALQQNKLCLVPVNKNILEYTSGNANVGVSTNVLNQRRYSSGDYGTGGHPEAVLIQDNSVYFVDESRQAVCALTGGQLVPISEKGMSSFFEDFFTNNHTKYVSGYDPRDNTYYVTGLGGTAETVGYDAARGAWQSRYSFAPDLYSNQNNMLYSAKYVDAATDLIFHKHDNTTAYNTFYEGSASPSEVQVVSKMSPSRVKVFNAISYEGNSADWDMNPGMETSLGQTSGTITSWKEKEGSYYASMPRNISSGSYGSNTRDIYAGNWVNSGDDTTFLVTNARLDRLPLDIVADHSLLNVFNELKSITINSVSAGDNGYTVVLDSPVIGVAGHSFIRVTENQSKSTDDVMRGNWAKITLTNSSTTKHELYCINTHITDSKSHHPLGQ